jgi:hypothetical protein
VYLGFLVVHEVLEFAYQLLARGNTEMSTYILMKVLESAPSRYDRGIRILTLGRLDKAEKMIPSIP